MRQKRNGFTKFMRKLDGVEDYDDVLTTEEIRRRLNPGSYLLVQFLRAEVDYRTYVQAVCPGGAFNCSTEERHALNYTREEIAGRLPSPYPVGLHESDPSTYREAVEYLLSHPACQRQGSDEASSSGERPPDNTIYGVSLSEFREYINPTVRHDCGPEASSSRTREEPVRDHGTWTWRCRE